MFLNTFFSWLKLVLLSEGKDADLLESSACLSILMMKLRDFLKDVITLLDAQSYIKFYIWFSEVAESFICCRKLRAPSPYDILTFLWVILKIVPRFRSNEWTDSLYKQSHFECTLCKVFLARNRPGNTKPNFKPYFFPIA